MKRKIIVMLLSCCLVVSSTSVAFAATSRKATSQNTINAKIDNSAEKKVIIEGNKFNDIEEFYSEIDKVLTKDLTWKTGHNLDAFNDLLNGGFGVHEYGEPITIIWKNSDKSKIDLGYSATVKHYRNMLKRCDPSNVQSVRELLKDAENQKGDTLFDIIIEIIKGHDEIELILE